jgi:hypothetical protein
MKPPLLDLAFRRWTAVAQAAYGGEVLKKRKSVANLVLFVVLAGDLAFVVMSAVFYLKSEDSTFLAVTLILAAVIPVDLVILYVFYGQRMSSTADFVRELVDEIKPESYGILSWFGNLVVSLGKDNTIVTLYIGDKHIYGVVIKEPAVLGVVPIKRFTRPFKVSWPKRPPFGTLMCKSWFGSLSSEVEVPSPERRELLKVSGNVFVGYLVCPVPLTKEQIRDFVNKLINPSQYI